MNPSLLTSLQALSGRRDWSKLISYVSAGQVLHNVSSIYVLF